MVNQGKQVMIKTKVESEVADWLEKERSLRNKSNVTSKALEFYYNYKFYKKSFLIRLIQENFDLAKHILRKIGSTRKQQEL